MAESGNRRGEGNPGQEATGSERRWYAIPVKEALGEMGVDPDQGLGEGEVDRRREEFGENRLREATRKNPWAILVDQFKSLIFALLAGAAVLSFVLSEVVQGFAILAAVAINAAIGFVTELKATRSMEALRRYERETTRVIRAGEKREVESAELVPGDIVRLTAGELVPADLRLIDTSGLQANESALTGESVPVGKTSRALEGEPPLAERENIAFKGTSIARGSGRGMVIGSGMNTELGRISEMAEDAQEARSPLERRLDQLAQRLLLVILIVAAVTAVIGVLAGRDVMLMVETGIALVVAAVPEGLPIVASVALARGMWRLARRNALIERLDAVETLGATTVICSDKTGTLTENRMALVRYGLARGEVRAAQNGEGFVIGGEPIDPDDDAQLRASLEIGVLCNAASLGGEEADGDACEEGDPMEVALLEIGRRADIRRQHLLERLPGVRCEEFDPDVKMMASYHRAEDGVLVAVKGAPEAVLDVCTRVLTEDGDTEQLDEEGRRNWLELNDDLAGSGLRALALAQKTVDSEQVEPYDGLTLVGFAGLLDPPRSEASNAMRECRDAGIHVVIVTGDQGNTARAIAAEVGLVDDAENAEVIEGAAMKPADQMSDEERRELLKTPIFARFSPAQKLDLIQLYQDAGYVVAMTGDGVNDAPALKTADIGIAMGQCGTEVARDAADMVLLDDSFATIVEAVRQGRAIFGNIRRFVLYMLSGNAGEIFAVSVVAFLNAPLPLLPLQILYINIVSDVFPALALGVGESSGDVMKDPPRDPKEPILTRRIWAIIGGYGILIGACALAVFFYALAHGSSQQEAVTISFLTFGFARLWHVFNMRDAGSPIFVNEITRNKFVWIAIAIGVALMLGAACLPVLTLVLDTAWPDARGWALIAIGSLAPLVAAQILKMRGPRKLIGRFR